MGSSNSHKKIMFTNLGDAFRYGLISEIPLIYKNSNVEYGVHFYASIAYMYLNGLLSQETTEKTYKHFLVGSVLGKNLTDSIRFITKSVFDELLNYDSFTNLDELVEILNKIVIPDWYFYVGLDLVCHSSNGIVLQEKYLFYISEDEDEQQFLVLNIDKIENGVSLDEHNGKILLGTGYSQIYGYDKKMKRIYLGVKNQTEFYHCFNIATNDFIINSNKFLTIRDGIPYIITKDNYFAYVLGDKIHKIKKYHPYENYVQQKDYFLVVPQSSEFPYFYPYCVTYDGKVIPANIEDCRKHIWRELESIVYAESRLHRMIIKANKDNNIRVKMPEELSINSIMNAFVTTIPNIKLCINDKFIVFESLFDLLSTYISPDDDITQLLYVLYDIDRNVRNGHDIFPSEELYWRFKEINNCKEDKEKIREAFKTMDYNTIKSIFLGDTPYKEETELETGLIGEFCFEKNNIKSYPVEKRYGTVIGNQIIHSTNLDDFFGFVSYDCLSDMYYITSVGPISKDDRMLILSDFQLYDKQFMFVVQRREKCDGSGVSLEKSNCEQKSCPVEWDEPGYTHLSSEGWEYLFASAKEFDEDLFDDEDF